MNSFVSDGNEPQRPLPPQTQRASNRKPGYGHNQRKFKREERPLDEESVFTFSSSSPTDGMNQYEYEHGTEQESIPTEEKNGRRDYTTTAEPPVKTLKVILAQKNKPKERKRYIVPTNISWEIFLRGVCGACHLRILSVR